MNPRLQRRRVFFHVLVALLAWCFLLRFRAVSSSLPFDTMYDIDLTTTIDSLLINDGVLASDLSHPRVGLHVLASATQRVAHALGFLTAASLSDLAGTMQPVWAAAELTLFLRAHSPYLCLGSVLLAWWAIFRRWRTPGWVALAGLLVLATQGCLVYSATTVRSEIYAIFYWSGALALASVAATSNRPVAWMGSLLAAGLLTGLCFVTKTQSLFLLPAVPVTYFLFRRCHEESTGGWPCAARRTPAVLAGCLALAVFIGLAACSRKVEVPGGVVVFCDFTGKPTPLLLAFLGAFAALPTLATIAAWRRPAAGMLEDAVHALSFIALGFVAAYFLLFLAYPSPGPAWHHLLLAHKVPFWGSSTLPEARQASSFAGILRSEFLGKYVQSWHRDPLLTAFSVGPTLLLAMGRALRLLRVRWMHVGLLALLSMFCFLDVALANRLIGKDDIFRQPIQCYTGMVGLAMIVGRCGPARRWVAPALGLVLAAAAIMQWRTSSRYVDDVFNDDWVLSNGYSGEHWLRGVYGGHHGDYTDIMSRFCERQPLEGLHDAERVRTIRCEAAMLLPGLSPDMRTLGAVYPGFPAWSGGRRDWRLKEVSPRLKGSVLLDAAAMMPSDGTRLRLHARYDQDVLVFLDPALVDRLPGPPEKRRRIADNLVIAKGNETKTLSGVLLLPGVHEIPREALGSDYLVVLHER